MAQTAALPILSGETGLTRYLEEIRRFPMLEPQEEFMLAKRWREHGDRDAAHRLVTSHLRLVAKIAMGYRGYGLPIAEVISEGNVGLMQAVKRFEPDKGFRLATYAMWWIKAAIQEYILRSWSLVKMGTTANQKKLFFNLRKAKSKISALDEGDMRPDQVKLIAKRLGVTEQDVIDMNRRLGGDASLNAPIREDGDSGEWMDWLVDDSVSQESRLAESEQSDNRHKALGEALTVLNDRERRIFEARRLADDPITLEELADEFGVSRERVRQIEVRAFEKVQKAVKNSIAHMENPEAAAAARDALSTAQPLETSHLPCPAKAGHFVLAGAASLERCRRMPRYRVAVDTGGTFSDFVYLNEDTGAVSVGKIPSTPDDPSRAILQGVEALIGQGVPAAEVGYFCHGTTVGTNALLEGKGVKTGLLVTEGFRGIYEVAEQARPYGTAIFDVMYDKPTCWCRRA